ncbi:MAG: Lon protease family protein [Candidatus Bathyarchaeia archaeon]
MVEELSYKEARWTLEEAALTCESTEELEPLEQIIGQERAVSALQFGLKIKEEGFNVFVAGHPGTGRRTAIINFLEEIAKDMPTPSDWCYVNNFDNPDKPNVMELPPGKGAQFKSDMEKFVQEMMPAIINAFESEDYSRRRQQVLEEYNQKKERLSQELNEKAKEAGFVIRQSPAGLLIVPVVNGHPVNDQQFQQLPEEKQREIREKRKELQDDLRSTFRELRNIDRDAQQAVQDFNKEVAEYAIEPLLDELEEKYGDIEEISDFLEDVKEDILDNLQSILSIEQTEQQGGNLLQRMMQAQDPRDGYKVNLIVDNSDLEGAPMIEESNPTFQRLFGLLEKEARFGALLTNYTMIQEGAAHKANGGFLVIPVRELLTNPLSWDSLKRAIRNEELEIEEPSQRLGFMTTKTLRPEPIPFDAKVVLFGSNRLYQILYMLDKDFKELFKVKADFDIVMHRTEKNIRDYTSFICTLCIKDELPHVDQSGISSIIEYSSRLAADKEKLSTKFAEVSDIIREAGFYASQEGSEYTTSEHVNKALEEKVYRSNLLQEKIEESIERDTILIDTENERIGQINGLAIMNLGDYMFGKPSRITASIGVGKEGVIDIEREAELAGPLHTKGVQILSGFLNDRYAKEEPLSLTGRIVFEQSYGGVDGDSASSTELYAILSELSGKPIKQYLAVTGSVNQKGEVQAIGGVNEKIEGYYEVCKKLGLTGKQGVVIPESNKKNLMLKEEVVEAIEAGKFHIYPVSTIDEGIEVLTGVKAGESKPDGTWPEGTINYLVQKRIEELAEKVKKYDS